MRWTLHSYWNGQGCRFPPFREALTIEQAYHAQLRQAIADLHPDVVTFWHMGEDDRMRMDGSGATSAFTESTSRTVITHNDDGGEQKWWSG